MAYDPRSARLALRYIGDGRPISNVPARDLSEHDICRLAYRRALSAVAGDVGRPVDPADPGAGAIARPDPTDPDQELVAVIEAELIARGQFAPVGVAKKPKHDTAPATPAGKEG